MGGRNPSINQLEENSEPESTSESSKLDAESEVESSESYTDAEEPQGLVNANLSAAMSDHIDRRNSQVIVEQASQTTIEDDQNEIADLDLIDDEAEDEFAEVFEDVFEEEVNLEDINGDADERIGYMNRIMRYNLRDFLRFWVMIYNVQRTAMDVLLKYLRGGNWRFSEVQIPACVRTLMGTPRSRDVRNVALGGRYVHFGIEYALNNINDVDYASLRGAKRNRLRLKLNWDGAVAAKSSRNTVWPIQAAICGVRMRPVIIGIYYGEHKPKDFDDFLRPFVDDVKKLQKGIRGGPMRLKLKGIKFYAFIEMIILDSPAKCDTVGIKQWTAKVGCPKCKVMGKKIKSK